MMRLVCPLCRELLCEKESSLVCPAGHSYDIARSGYVNLLPPGRRSNARTGDDSGMVAARRDFLSRGYYDTVELDAAELVSLFEMTPFRYRSRPDAAERVASHGKSRMTVSVMCNILIKKPNTFQ